MTLGLHLCTDFRLLFFDFGRHQLFVLLVAHALKLWRRFDVEFHLLGHVAVFHEVDVRTLDGQRVREFIEPSSGPFFALGDEASLGRGWPMCRQFYLVRLHVH